MDSQEIIKSVAKYYSVKPDKIVKLMTVPDTYQMGTQRFTAVYNDDLYEKALEILPETISRVFRDLGASNFIRYGRVQLKTPKELDLLHLVAEHGKDANQFLFGLIKDMPRFLNEASHHVGWSMVFGADDSFQLTINRMYMQIFILHGQFPPVEEEGVTPEQAPNVPAVAFPVHGVVGTAPTMSGIYATGASFSGSTITFRTQPAVVTQGAVEPDIDTDDGIPF